MSTHRVSMLGFSVASDSTGRCWYETYDTIATNDVWRHNVLRLVNPSSGQVHGFYGTFEVPQNYVSTASIIAVWTTTATSGDPNFRLTYRAVGGSNSESMDQTSNQEQLSLTNLSAPGAAHRRMEATFDVTDGNFAAGDTVEFLFERMDNSGGDQLAADVIVFDLLFVYNDN